MGIVDHGVNLGVTGIFDEGVSIELDDSGISSDRAERFDTPTNFLEKKKNKFLK